MITRVNAAWIAAALLGLMLITACSGAGANEQAATPGPTPTATANPADGEPVVIGAFTGLLWGSGDYGVVLVGASGGSASSWREPALALAAEDMTALALNDYSYTIVVEAIEYLQQQRRVQQVALIGVSTGAPPVIGAGIIRPELVDQIIVVSGFGEYQDMGEFPKLFIAAEGEAGMVRRARQMASESAGTDNEALILPGSAGGEALFNGASGDALLAAIIERLNAFR